MKRLLEGLKEQEAKYQCMPFWSWNDKLESEQLVKQIGRMQESGVGGYVMHARGGLKTPYLSEEWMQCIEACVEAAKERGMEAWVYDENGWPSGFVGGKLLEKEENRDCYMTYEFGTYDEAAWLVYLIEGDELKRISKPQEGECLNVYFYVSPSSVDILNPDVVDQFIAETHEKYAERFGEKMSESLAGFFTDEPQYYRWQMPYTRMMPKVYKEKYGEDVLEQLGLLFVEKKGYQKFRYRYWLTMHELMLKNFAEKIYNWCEDHGVKLTGHYVEETTLGFQMSCCGGVMPFYEFMHVPGIDWLNRSIGNILSLRQIASVAKQMGKKHIVTETFGCCGWDVTPQELKQMGDFQYIGGVNRMCQHLVPYSEHGQRKRDYPAHFSQINPWVESEFGKFNDYFTRLGYLLSNLEEPVNVAMLHPMRSAYLEFRYRRSIPDGIREGFHIQELEDAFLEQHGRLTQSQIPFHFLDETLLERHGFVEEDKIGCGLCKYEYLVIPKCYTMGKHTEKLLRQYVENGGKVLLMGGKPEYLEGEPYDYGYLKSTVSFEELSEGLPYRLQTPIKEMHSALRQTEDGWVLFVQNYGTEEKLVSYELTEGYTSFERWDLDTLTCEVIPTQFVLDAGQSCVLVFSKEEAKDHIEKSILYLESRAEIVDMTENYLTLDVARYSKDGSNYSEELPCMGIFEQLLKERYEGTLYIKYEFDVEKVSKNLGLIVEKNDGMKLAVNGHSICASRIWERDHQFERFDISPWVVNGKNEIVTEIQFYQSESVYYALFGENVTENLRNCLSYDTEIEPIYLAGDFGVYGKTFKQGKKEGILLGSGFCLGEAPREVENLITEGFPFFSGRMRLRREVQIDKENVILRFQNRFHTITVWVNGRKVDTLMFRSEVDISNYIQLGTNEIVIELLVGNRNMMGPHHIRHDEEPFSVTPESFQVAGELTAGENEFYRKDYAFVPVHIR